MNYKQKVAYFSEKFPAEWFSYHRIAWQELSDAQPIFCVCGRLATGLHEGGCSRFAKEVNKETIRHLEELEARNGSFGATNG